jgi:hypothetical protein
LLTQVEMAFLVGDHEAVHTLAEEAIAIGRAVGDDRLQAYPRYRQSAAALRQGNTDDARDLAQVGLALARPTADGHLTACLLAALGNTESGDDGAFRHYEEARSLAEKAGGGDLLATILINLSLMLLEVEDEEGARAAITEAATIAREEGLGSCALYAGYNLGLVELLAGNHTAARRAATSTVIGARRSGEDFLVVYGVLLSALARVDDAAAGATLHGVADRLFAERGFERETIEEAQRAADVARLRVELGDAAFEAAFATGAALSREEGLALALADP